MWVLFLHFLRCCHSENQIPATRDMIQSDACHNLLHVISSVRKKGWDNNSLKHKSIMFMPGFIVMSLWLIWVYCIGELQQKRRGQCCDEIQWLLGLVNQKMKEDTSAQGWEMEKQCHFNNVEISTRCVRVQDAHLRRIKRIKNMKVHASFSFCEQRSKVMWECISWLMPWYYQHHFLYFLLLKYLTYNPNIFASNGKIKVILLDQVRKKSYF